MRPLSLARQYAQVAVKSKTRLEELREKYTAARAAFDGLARWMDDESFPLEERRAKRDAIQAMGEKCQYILDQIKAAGGSYTEKEIQEGF